jgi:hypothetical protein
MREVAAFETVLTVCIAKGAEKPLKRFRLKVSLSTGLKPGVNEKTFEAKLLDVAG